MKKYEKHTIARAGKTGAIVAMIVAEIAADFFLDRIESFGSLGLRSYGSIFNKIFGKVNINTIWITECIPFLKQFVDFRVVTKDHRR